MTEHEPGRPPPPSYTVQGAASTNGLAIASLVVGILWMFGLGSILALVFGYMAKSQIDRSGGREGGRGLAVAGIVLGWVGVGTFLLFLLLGLGVGFGSGTGDVGDVVIIEP